MKLTILGIATGIAVAAWESGYYFYSGLLMTVAICEFISQSGNGSFSLVWKIFSDVSRSKRGYLDFVSADFDQAVIKETVQRAQDEGIAVTEREVRRIGYYRFAATVVSAILLVAVLIVFGMQYAA